MVEIYFAQRKDALTNDLVKELTQADYVKRLYTASTSGKKEFYLVGVASKSGRLIPEKQEAESFSIPINEVLFDFKKEPTYIAIIRFQKDFKASNFSFFDCWKNTEGLSYRKHYKTYGQGPYYHYLKSKIVRVVLSGSLTGIKSQALIVEFDESQTSAKKFMNIVKDNMEKNSISIIGSESFSLLGENMKKHRVVQI